MKGANRQYCTPRNSAT